MHQQGVCGTIIPDNPSSKACSYQSSVYIGPFHVLIMELV